MNVTLEKIADLLMYVGPNIELKIREATLSGNNTKIYNDNGLKRLVIESQLPYKLKVIDTYIYNEDDELIKHTIQVNKKEKVVFNKFSEVNDLLNTLNKSAILIS